MNLALIETAQKFLFADEREMQEAGLSQTTRGRMIRLRDIYNHWLAHPRLLDKDIVVEIIRRYRIGKSMAYEDLKIIKFCLGAMNQSTVDFERWQFRQRLDEAWNAVKDALITEETDTLAANEIKGIFKYPSNLTLPLSAQGRVATSQRFVPRSWASKPCA